MPAKNLLITHRIYIAFETIPLFKIFIIKPNYFPQKLVGLFLPSPPILPWPNETKWNYLKKPIKCMVKGKKKRKNLLLSILLLLLLSSSLSALFNYYFHPWICFGKIKNIYIKINRSWFYFQHWRKINLLIHCLLQDNLCLFTILVGRILREIAVKIWLK